MVFTGVRYGANVRCGEYGAFRLQQQTTTSSHDRPLVRRPPSGLGRVGGTLSGEAPAQVEALKLRLAVGSNGAKSHESGQEPPGREIDPLVLAACQVQCPGGPIPAAARAPSEWHGDGPIAPGKPT